MNNFLTPGKPPYAASALIFSADGSHILSVSRKHDFEDLGLPGGKVDPGENFQDAVIREVAEETGVQVNKLVPFFGDYCGTPGIHHVHWCLTFICQATGEIHTTEKGRVVWVPPARIVRDDNGKLNSFSNYNYDMFEALNKSGINPKEFYSKITVPCPKPFYRAYF